MPEIISGICARLEPFLQKIGVSSRLAQTSRCEVCGFMERPERSQTSQNSERVAQSLKTRDSALPAWHCELNQLLRLTQELWQPWRELRP
jgi:hypothetical protein